MTKFIGRLADIGIAKETSRGTAESAATFWLPKTSLTYDDTIEQVVDESNMGVIEDSPNAAVIAKSGEGSIEGNIGAKSFGLLLLSALGGVSTSGPSDSAYTHTFSVLESAQHPSLTLFLDDPNQDYKYALAMLDTLEIDVLIGAFAKFVASFRSKVGATATLTPSYSAEDNFLPQHGSLIYASALSGLGFGTAFNIRSLKLKIEKNIEDDRNIGSTDPTDILNKQFSITGSVEFVFTDNTFKSDMLADTAKAIRLQLSNSDVTIGSSTHPKLTFDLAKVKFSNFKRNYDNNSIVTATADFKGFYSLSDAKMVAAVVINTQSSY
jgi:hypothetical protein